MRPAHSQSGHDPCHPRDPCSACVLAESAEHGSDGFAPYSLLAVSSPGVEPGPRPSEGRMRSVTLRGPFQISNLRFQIPQKPCRGIEPRSAVYRTAMSPSHPQGSVTGSGVFFACRNRQPTFRVARPAREKDSRPFPFNQCLAWELNPVRRIKSPLCQPLHPQGNCHEAHAVRVRATA